MVPGWKLVKTDHDEALWREWDVVWKTGNSKDPMSVPRAQEK